MNHPAEENGRVAIRRDWGTAVEIEPGLFRLRLFNPRGSLLINTYIYKSPGHLAIIDPGWPWTFEALEVALRDLGLGRLADVDQWLYTHTHIDHMGLAAVLADYSDAGHFAASSVEPHLDDWHGFQDRTNDWFAWGQTAFADPERSLLAKERAQAEAGQRKYSGLTHQYGARAVENAVLFDIGDSIQVGDLQFEIHDASGHDPTHVAFFERSRGWMFAGDAVIATPTPISRSMDDDLALYEATLTRLQVLPTQLLLPGHGVQKTDRIDASFERSRGFITTYRQNVLDVLAKQTKPEDIHTLALALTPDGQPFKPEARWWVHIALVDSHLQWLVRQGTVALHDGPTYQLV